MTNRIYDSANPLPAPGENALLLIPDGGNTIIDLDIVSPDKVAVQATATQQILVATRNVQGHSYGLDLRGTGSGVTNNGTIKSDTSAAILFSGGGTSTVTNSGTINGVKGIRIDSTATTAKLNLLNTGTVSATGTAVEGGKGDDRVVNVGTLTTTTAGTKLIDLGDGSDFFDGKLGTTSGIIDLGSGNDTAYGGNGSETFVGGAGTDYIDGGGGASGIDIIDYSGATNGVTINLGLTSSQYISSDQGYDTLLDIEGITGSAHNDTLTGSSGDNTLNGGDGIDTVLYTGSSAITIDLSLTTGQTNSGYGKDVLLNIENVEAGGGADKLTGNDAANKLVGNTGNDTLTGGRGNDTLEGGTGRNTAVYSGTRAEYTISAVDAASNYTITDTIGNRDGIDSLKSVRFVQFSDQTIAVTNGAPTDVSLARSTLTESTSVGTSISLFGSDPDSDALTYTLLTPSGHFAIENGSLVLKSALDYEAATAHDLTIQVLDGYGGIFMKTVTVKVSNVYETNPIYRNGSAASDEIVGEYGNDTLNGLDGNDRIFGMKGNDYLTGGNGNDYLISGDGISSQSGNDTLVGGNGNDSLTGADGNDVFVFDQKPNKKTNLDNILDFNPVDDTIWLSRSVFKKISKGTLSSKAFVTGDHFKDSSDRILYHKKAGALFYDPDGNGPSKSVQFASIGVSLAIKATDFFIV